ncbi:MAG: aminotransferase class I/II-fold pyridoxal phosphate-dependent enzyme [Candidatus Eisenbacteria bacterium]|uniref:Aminotransferase class I/II-fold pyridoxal phosphate-dependent enzyme n=1 Tax=Eiseniibacteriota bacterium TaxID=2212470 RepID=A0A849SIW0_UNCEI|nr:aminotransferase class I/II-fold pyridoxal phosphate-dependent enzyme [Candidatus Eisenbacteria bacterium]
MSPDARTASAAGDVTDASLSKLARGLIGSEVLRIAAEVRALVASGTPVCNLTVGDFDPREFPLPKALLEGIPRALAAGHSNYPPSNGVLELRQSVARFFKRELGLDYPIESVVIAGGARPLIYASYLALLDRGDAVAFPVPSWNNNHYAYLAGARPLPLEVTREHAFHPTPEQVASVIGDVQLISLSTPLNPTGTTMDPEVLRAISKIVVDENARRSARGERLVFLLFDQVYWLLAFENGRATAPPVLLPEVMPYTVLIDAASKSFAATGLRVGWALAAPAVAARLSDLLGHIGAWAPKAEQIAIAQFLDDAPACAAFRAEMHERLRARLSALHRGLSQLQKRGFPIESVEPEGTLYLSMRLDLFGRTVAGREIRTNEDLRRLLLEEAGLAVVPFQAFALRRENGWMRLSVGAVSVEAIEAGMKRLASLLEGVV